MRNETFGVRRSANIAINSACASSCQPCSSFYKLHNSLCSRGLETHSSFSSLSSKATVSSIGINRISRLRRFYPNTVMPSSSGASYPSPPSSPTRLPSSCPSSPGMQLLREKLAASKRLRDDKWAQVRAARTPLAPGSTHLRLILNSETDAAPPNVKGVQALRTRIVLRRKALNERIARVRAARN